MPGASAHKPHIFHFRMPVNQKITIRTVFVLANTRLDDRRVFQYRKAPCHILSNDFRHLRRHDPRLRVRIYQPSMLVKRNLQSPSLDVRHSIHQLLLKQPGGQRRRRKPCIARRNAEEEHFLSRRKDSRAEKFWEYFSKPRATSKHELSRDDFLAIACCHFVRSAGSRGFDYLCATILNSKTYRVFYYG